jgi:K+-sensing histidine kinase KdpD
MALFGDGGPGADSIQGDQAQRAERASWANVVPLERGPAGAVGQWIDLLSSISHELRTPLNAVIGFSDAMQQEVFGPIGNVRYREYVDHIRSSGVELLKAAEDALAMTAVLAQPKAGLLEDVELAPLVAVAAEEICCVGPARRLSVDIDIPEGLEVRGDRRILPRAIRQLIAVAQARAAEGSRLRIAAEGECGLVELRIEVSELAGDVAPLFDARLEATHAGMGLGRRELALWLATALLDLIDCRLEVVAERDRLRLRTTLEQSAAGLFGPVASV